MAIKHSQRTEGGGQGFPGRELRAGRVQMMTPVKPGRLAKGDSIGLISPAGWMSEADIERGSDVLKAMGFVPVVHPSNHLRDNHFAGAARERADAIGEMFLDPEVRALICTRGGYGTEEVLGHVNYDVARRHPKCVVGFSDTTALLLALGIRTGLVTFHGPMLQTFKQGIEELTVTHLFRALTQAVPWSYDLKLERGLRVLRAGQGRGPLMGGNLTILTDLIGTDYEPPFEGCILFFEDIDEELYRIDRMLLHLKRAGKLRNLQGMLVGQMTNIIEEKIRLGRALDEIVLDLCEGTDFPIVAGFPCGHRARLLTIPIGCPASLSAGEEGVRLAMEEAPVTRDGRVT
jgi:muramoyltetrapeptide carboxypeptidase